MTEVAAEAPPMGSPQWKAQRLAESLLKEDQAREVLRERQQPATATYDAAADERRRWALIQAVNAQGPQYYGPSPGGEAMLINGRPVRVTRKDGLIAQMEPAQITRTLILPHQWDEHDQAWQQRRRSDENHLLARHYGAEMCVREGLFTQEEAAGLDPERSRHVVLPAGSPR